MRAARLSLAICVPLMAVAMLLAGGCGKKDDARPAAQAPVFKMEDKAAIVPSPPLPEVNAPKGAEVQSPQPGQANDHSSPAFKAGGAPDAKK